MQVPKRVSWHTANLLRTCKNPQRRKNKMQTRSVLFKTNPAVMRAIQKEYAFTPEQMYTAATALDTFAVTRLPSGNFQLRSTSRPNIFHQVNPRAESCTCERGKKNELCYHLAVWVYVKRMPMDEWIGYCADARTTAILAQAELRKGAPVTAQSQNRKVGQKENPIAIRERAAQAKRTARAKVEWREELA